LVAQALVCNVELKDKDKTVPVHVMEMYMGSMGLAPHILLNTRWR